MKRQDYPIYQSALNYYLACDNVKFSKLMENLELTQVEKNLLNVRKLFSVGQYREAITLLSALSDPDCHFLKGEKYLLFASAHANLGEWENSFLYNGHAIENYRRAPDRRGEFLSTYNLSVDASSMGLKKISLDQLKKAKELALTLEERLLILRAEACDLSQERNYSKAVSVIKEALDLCDEKKDENTNQLDILTLHVVASDIFFRAGDMDEALKLLNQIKNEKLLKLRSRVYFNLGVIKLIRDGELGSMAKYVEKSSEYSLKWRILESIIVGDLKMAEELWGQLKMMFPNIYREPFACFNKFDEESLFFQGICSIRRKVAAFPMVTFPKGSKLDILHKSLLDSKLPLRKEELIERVWNTSYDPAFDSRFYKLVQRLKDLSLPVSNEHRAYFYKKVL